MGTIALFSHSGMLTQTNKHAQILSQKILLVDILFYLFQMAAKPLTTEAIALTEKKMDMTLGVNISV